MPPFFLAILAFLIVAAVAVYAIFTRDLTGARAASLAVA